MKIYKKNGSEAYGVLFCYIEDSIIRTVLLGPGHKWDFDAVITDPENYAEITDKSDLEILTATLEKALNKKELEEIVNKGDKGLRGYRVEKWYKAEMHGFNGNEPFGYFKSVVGVERGQQQGVVYHEVYVLTCDGKTGYLLSEKGTLVALSVQLEVSNKK